MGLRPFLRSWTLDGTSSIVAIADACLVPLVGRTDRVSIMTLDSGFHVYRQPRRRIIPLLSPA